LRNSLRSLKPNKVSSHLDISVPSPPPPIYV
jgi:hypothetical protein